MKITFVLSGLVTATVVQTGCPYAEQYHKRQLEAQAEVKEKRQSGPAGLPFTTFNTNQLVDVTGEHAWAPPGPNDIRGPCPGLNALANHGYFPRSGIVPLPVGASAPAEVYGTFDA